MTRSSSKTVNIGDLFHTWRVIKKVEGKYNYNYECECIYCGSKKTIEKYSLLKNRYALCRNCGVKSVLESNMDEIMTYWNKDLNGSYTMEEIFSNPNATYWFTCAKGHNFKKTLRDFSPEQCPTCKRISLKNAKPSNDKPIGRSFADNYPTLLQYWNYRRNKTTPGEVLLDVDKKKYWFICSEGHEFQRTPNEIIKGKWCPYCDINTTESRLTTLCKNIFSKMYKNIKCAEEFPIEIETSRGTEVVYPSIVIEDIKLVIDIHGIQHREYSKSIHSNESNYVSLVLKDRAKKKWILDHGYNYHIIEATRDFERDVDSIEQFVIRLSHEL